MWQTSTNVRIPTFRQDATKSVTTSPVVFAACVKMATSSMTTSTVLVRSHPVEQKRRQLGVCFNDLYLIFTPLRLEKQTPFSVCSAVRIKTPTLLPVDLREHIIYFPLWPHVTLLTQEHVDSFKHVKGWTIFTFFFSKTLPQSHISEFFDAARSSFVFYFCRFLSGLSRCLSLRTKSSQTWTQSVWRTAFFLFDWLWWST